MSDVIQWFDGHGYLQLDIALEEAQSCWHPGPCDADVLRLSKEPHIAEQLDALEADTVRKVLREYGAWDDAELADHPQNLQRLLWIACCDVAERPEDFDYWIEGDDDEAV